MCPENIGQLADTNLATSPLVLPSECIPGQPLFTMQLLTVVQPIVDWIVLKPVSLISAQVLRHNADHAIPVHKSLTAPIPFVAEAQVLTWFFIISSTSAMLLAYSCLATVLVFLPVTSVRTSNLYMR